MKDEPEFFIEFADDDWKLSQPGYRPVDQVVYLDGVEVARELSRAWLLRAGRRAR